MKGPKDAATEDVWGGLTGSEVGESFSVGGLGLVGTGRGGGGTGEGTIGLGTTGLIGKGGGVGSGYGRGFGGRFDREPDGGTFALPPDAADHSRFIRVSDDPLSTFSIDVDTASYSSTRRDVMEYGSLPDADAVRIEELVNYFDYDYAAPSGEAPFSITAEVGTCPWDPEHQLVHVGLQGQELALDQIPPRNLVFLVDVSGSMHSADKLPLVQYSLGELAKTLRAEDRISVVTYAGSAGVVLPPTRGDQLGTILGALEGLQSGGGTNGAAGIEQAYELAHAAFIEDGVNRVIMATDGDFNVGLSSHDALVRMIEAQRKGGVELSVLGYGMGHRDHTMEQLADKGNGNYAYIDGRQEARKVLVEEAGATLVTIAKDVKIQVELDPARVQSYRLIGYDNRRLAHADFADDTKDAGEIGAGHTVTALYEVVPRADADEGAPWMTLSLRYKQPKGSRSSLLSLPVGGAARELDDTSDDFRFSAAVASYGMLVRQAAGRERTEPQPGSDLAKDESEWRSTLELATGALGEDEACRRHQFVEIAARSATLAGATQAGRLAVHCELGGERSVEPLPPEPVPAPVVEPEPELEPESESLPEPSFPDLLAPTDEPPPPRSPPPPADESEAKDWTDVALEVLRLLPPLLAFPLFIMAWRWPRRRD
ncbi:MAG: VWA domain-containing protein [Myxococcales bacterium]|nr:VWA domain-containing protein [Myxococcales bacterium]